MLRTIRCLVATVGCTVASVIAQNPQVSVELLPLGLADAYVNPNFAAPVTSSATATPGPVPLGVAFLHRTELLPSYSVSEIEILSTVPARVEGMIVAAAGQLATPQASALFGPDLGAGGLRIAMNPPSILSL
jgi:hypothetical protein